MREYYTMLKTAGAIVPVVIEQDQLLEGLHKALECDCVESVRTVLPGILLIVDESGKVKTPPKELNLYASMLYGGFIHGEYIAGDAMLATERQVDGEMEWAPLSSNQIQQVLAHFERILEALDEPEA